MRKNFLGVTHGSHLRPVFFPENPGTLFTTRETAPKHPRVVLLVLITHTVIFEFLPYLRCSLAHNHLVERSVLSQTFLVTYLDLVSPSFIQVSSLQRICVQSSGVQCWWASARDLRNRLFLSDRGGFFRGRRRA